MSETLLRLTHITHLLPQCLDLSFQAVDRLQFQPEQALHFRITQFISFGDRPGERLDRLFHVTLPESLRGPAISQLRLTLLQAAIDQSPIIKDRAKGHNLFPDKDIPGRNPFPQDQSLQRRTTAQGDIGLPSGKNASGQIHHDTAESQALALMHRDRPSQTDRQLLESPDNLLLDPFLLLIITILIIPPGGRLHQMLDSILQEHINMPFRVDARDHTNRPVHPTTLMIVIYEYDLRMLLEREIQQGR